VLKDYFNRASQQRAGPFKPFSEVSRTDFSPGRLHRARLSEGYESEAEEESGRAAPGEADAGLSPEDAPYDDGEAEAPSGADGDAPPGDDGAAAFVEAALDYRVDGETVRDKVWNFLAQFKTLASDVNDAFRKGQAAAQADRGEEYSRRELRVALLAAMADSPVGNQGGLAEELAKTVCFGPEVPDRDETLRDLRDSYSREDE
jgi:hypothetical protein